MRLWNALVANWKTMSTAEKVKTVLHGLVMIGGGVIGNGIGDTFSAGSKPVAKACAKVTGFALGGVIADAAAKNLDETVDTFDQLIKARKNKEENANA